MKSKRWALGLIISGLVVFYLFISMSTSETVPKGSERALQPAPVRAPEPVIAEMQSTPQPKYTLAVQTRPQPQPVPEPPRPVAVTTVSTTGEAAGLNRLPTLFFIGTVGLFIGFLILISRRQSHGRYAEAQIMANGAQS